MNFPSTQKDEGFVTSFAKAQETNGRTLYVPLTTGDWELKFEMKEDSNLFLVSDFFLIT